MKKKMPAFLEKKKRDPRAMNPAKNTKGKSVTKVKTKVQDDKEQDRGSNLVEAQPMPNKADAALAMLQKPRSNRSRY